MKKIKFPELKIKVSATKGDEVNNDAPKKGLTGNLITIKTKIK